MVKLVLRWRFRSCWMCRCWFRLWRRSCCFLWRVLLFGCCLLIIFIGIFILVINVGIICWLIILSWLNWCKRCVLRLIRWSMRKMVRNLMLWILRLCCKFCFGSWVRMWWWCWVLLVIFISFIVRLIIGILVVNESCFVWFCYEMLYCGVLFGEE